MKSKLQQVSTRTAKLTEPQPIALRRRNSLVVYQLILMFDVNGKTVKIVGGCLPSEERHCKSLMPLSTTPLQCGAVEKDVRRCSVEGWNRFVIEKKKRQYYIYPAFYNKPDRHFYIPLASIDDSVVAPD